MPDRLTHFDADGRVRMVDVSDKPEASRRAVARGRVRMAQDTLETAVAGRAGKGDVIGTAELAAVTGAKRTSDLVPLCHPLPLTSVHARVQPDADLPGLVVEVEARTTGRTGVEMEALTGVSVACLTIYDMLKAMDRGMTVENIHLVEKTGGSSGTWRREPGGA